MNELSLIIVAPDDAVRRGLAEALERESVTISAQLTHYSALGEVEPLLQSGACNVAVVELDSDPDAALDFVAQVCDRDDAIVVLVCSSSRNQDLALQCMRAGARELLPLPVSPSLLAETLARVRARRQDLRPAKNTPSAKRVVFSGSKGGVGVTTLASHFAIALRAESAEEVALIDLNLRLGDVALALGLDFRFTIADALSNPDHLDGDFLSTLFVNHPSGVSVLPGPNTFSAPSLVQNGNLRKLLLLLPKKFSYMVMDAGPSLGPECAAIFEHADLLYLVMEPDLISLRNAQQLKEYVETNHPNTQLEILLNRYDRRRTPIDERRISEVLKMPLTWKVPSDYMKVQQSLNTGVALTSGDSPLSRVLHQMARVVCDKPIQQRSWQKKWGFL